METSGYKKDTAGEMDSLEKNAGMIARRIKDSKPFELYGRLHTDISFQIRYLINNVDMVVLRIIRNQSSFGLMGDGVQNYVLFADEATLYMRQVKINPAVMLQHAMALEKATIKYPFTRVETIQYTFNKGVVWETFDNVSSGILPKRIILEWLRRQLLKVDIRRILLILKILIYLKFL